MKAVQYAEQGGPEVLHVVDVDEPHAGSGQIRIAVRAVGVNPVDWKFRKGLMPVTLPHIPGSDVAGVVDEVGSGVTGVTVGDGVLGSAVGSGTAEFAVLENVVAKPASMTWEEAAALPTAAETSVRAFGVVGLQSGETLLVNAAAGGVGTAAVQLARARGVTVIGTASEDNHEFLQSLGATPTTYGPGLADRVRVLAPNGVDRALDASGRGALADLIEITGSPERVVTIADPEAGKYGVLFTGGGGGRAWEALAEATALYEQGRLVLPVAATFPLTGAPEAHRISEVGHVRGKLVITLH